MMQTCDFCKQAKRALVLIERINVTLCYLCMRNLRKTAPDLLTACEAALAYMDSVIQYQEMMGIATAEDTLEIHAMLEQAIAKARGKGTR